MSRKEYQKSWHKKDRDSLRAKGICYRCRKNKAQENKSFCKNCAIKGAIASRKYDQSHPAQEGFCSCGKVAEHRKRTCSQCNEKNKNNYLLRKQNGICSYCSNESLAGKTKCSACANKHKSKRQILRVEVFNAYGGFVCKCCGETLEKFLTIDHINNDGNKHRKALGRTSILKWLKDNDYPPGFQVLCFNCNIGKRLNGGSCPHT